MRKTWRPVILALLSMMLIEVSVSLAAMPQLKSSSAALQQVPPVPFLFPPYYGTEQVNSVFDHEYPFREGTIPTTRTDVITTVVHYDGTRWTGTVDSCTLGTPSCYSGHSGIDYSLRYERVRACANGTVTAAGWQDPRDHGAGIGLRVRIRHNNGYRCTLYACIPSPRTAADGAVYRIHQQGQENQAIVAQVNFPKGGNHRAYLGRYSSNLDGTESVRLTNEEEIRRKQ